MAKYKLGEICDIVSGSTPKTGIPEYWDGDLKWITPAEISDDSYVITDSVRKLTELGVKKTGLSPLPVGTVILSSRAPIGKVAIAGCEMYCNQGFKNLICSDKINNRYLYWFLKENTAFLNSLGRGATFKEISKQIVASIEINVPSLTQQLKAVEKLECVSSIIQLRKQQLQKLDELVKARFVEMFGDLSQNTRNYPVKKLSDIADYWNGLTYKPSDAVGSDVGTLVLRSSNIQNGELVFEDNVFVNCAIKEKLYVQDNDILMCSRNGSAALVGKTALINGFKKPTTFGAFMMIIRSNYYPYLKTYFELPFFRNQISTGTSTINQITGKMLNNIQLPVPDMETVSQFENFIHQNDKSKLAVQKSLEKTQQLFDSLMQEYFG